MTKRELISKRHIKVHELYYDQKLKTKEVHRQMITDGWDVSYKDVVNSLEKLPSEIEELKIRYGLIPVEESRALALRENFSANKSERFEDMEYLIYKNGMRLLSSLNNKSDSELDSLSASENVTLIKKLVETMSKIYGDNRLEQGLSTQNVDAHLWGIVAEESKTDRKKIYEAEYKEVTEKAEAIEATKTEEDKAREKGFIIEKYLREKERILNEASKNI